MEHTLWVKKKFLVLFLLFSFLWCRFIYSFSQFTLWQYYWIKQIIKSELTMSWNWIIACLTDSKIGFMMIFVSICNFFFFFFSLELLYIIINFRLCVVYNKNLIQFNLIALDLESNRLTENAQHRTEKKKERKKRRRRRKVVRLCLIWPCVSKLRFLYLNGNPIGKGTQLNFM